MQLETYTDLAKITFVIFAIVGLQAHSLMADSTRGSMVNAYTNPDSLEATEILWLARILYSESKVREEQIVVAWVVRNRVESGFRGAESYKDVALSKSQFSGLWPSDTQYKLNISRTYDTIGDKAWDQAVSIAQAIYFADSGLRPISENVRHFYSPISVVKDPNWTKGKKPTMVLRAEDGAVRFAFYDGVK